jgi:hypothetical protein
MLGALGSKEIVSAVQESLGRMLAGRCRNISNAVDGEVLGVPLRGRRE